MPGRVDVELVRRGLARSRAQAAALVSSGRVLSDGRPVAKPAAPTGPHTVLAVVPDADDAGHVSRAGGKLAGALDALAAHARGSGVTDRVQDGVCLDLGASTGGFTDVLLRRGAAGVVALDVGHGQLVPELRADPRVTVVEGFNVRDLTADDLQSPPDLVVGDLSFISLRLVVPAVARSVGAGVPAVLLVKPQFEVGRERLGHGGVVRDPALHVRSVVDVAAAARHVGLVPRGVVPSPLPGPSGNREYFVWFVRADDPSVEAPPTEPVPPDAGPEDAVVAAAERAVAWQPGDGLPPVELCGTVPEGAS